LVLAAAVALSLVGALVVAIELPPAPVAAPAASAGRAVPVHAVPVDKATSTPMRTQQRVVVSFPSAGTGTAVVADRQPVGRQRKAGPTAGSAQAGHLPVSVGPPAVPPASGTAPVTAVSRARVVMAGRPAADAVGVHGAVFTVGRADGGSASGWTHVSVDYHGFAHAYGGDYASRLRIVELPACALTTPRLARCRQQTPIPAGSADDIRTDQVGADVRLPAANAPAMVLAVTAAVSGSAGNFSVPPTSETNEWVNGGSSGAYRYSYPVQVPAVPGGLQPKINLDYDSQATDGLNSSTNNQPSWLGEGWNYSPGYVETEYPTCSTVGGLAPKNTGDLCQPTTATMTMSLNGVSSTLVCSSSACHAEADGGGKLTQVPVSPGSTQHYWLLTQPDGSKYYFGLNQLPGFTTGSPTTNSVWNVPVWQSTHYTTLPWRWNLDYVVDMHGDAMAYFYTPRTNYYAENNGTTGSASYVRGGVLSKIEYGLRATTIYSALPAAQVNFTTTTGRQDTPTDLVCSSGAACAVTSPTFWNDDALTGITTQYLAGGALQDADSWTLADTYPDPGDTTTAPALWLASIIRTGKDGATPITLPPTTFTGTPKAGRVQTAADTSAGYSKLTRLRLTSLTTDTGGTTSIAYSAPNPVCAAGTFPSPSANTTTCYPDYWLPNSSSTSPTLDWFNLYTTSTVTLTDTTGGAPPDVTSYTYNSAAWHVDDDTMSRSATKTWDQWRGYRTVTVETGTAPDPVTKTVNTYLQGMSGGTTTVTVTSSHGDTITDADYLASMLFESIVYNGASGGQVVDKIYLAAGTMTGTDSGSGLSSYMMEDAGSKTYTTLAGGGTRESVVADTYGSGGGISQEIDVPDTADSSQTTCTLTTYATDTTDFVLNEPAEVTVLATGMSSNCAASSAAQVVSATKYTYNSAFDVTKTQKATSATFNGLTGLAFTYATVSTGTYDQYGRPLTATDPDNRSTITAYTPATGAAPTSVQVTDPAGLVTTTTYDPARNLALTATDPAGYQTTTTYDALGRPLAKWTPGNPTTGPAVQTYAYSVTNDAPSVTATQVEEPGGGYLTTQTLSDSLGRVREVQQETAGGGTDITDTTYNSDGWKSLVSAPYYTAAAPSGTLLAAASTDVPAQTGYVYDGDGRVTEQIAYALGVQTWQATTVYGGSFTTVIPPPGGTRQTTLTDGRGLTTAIYTYHAGVPADPSDPAADYDKTAYTYTAAKQLASITDAAGDMWTDTYDLLGNQLTSSTPDAGKTTSTYDTAGQTLTTTDARGKQNSFTYDNDGRRTAAYDTTGGAAATAADQVASWTYDTLAKGRPTSSTSFQGGAAYTQQVTGYNAEEQPSGTATVIPDSQGTLAGTYTRQYGYAPDGQMTSYTDSAAGALPTETVTIGYDPAGEPNSLNGTSAYVTSLSYTDLGQPLQYAMGSAAQPAHLTYAYDPQTANLTERNLQVGSAQTSVDDQHYGYDDVGSITSEADTPSGDPTATDVQCFQYDYAGRLAQAWAQGSAGCATTPSAGAEGGAAPYWDSYTYNAIGNQTATTSTTGTGTATTTAFTYPAVGSAQPHAPSTMQVVGAGTTSYGYDPGGDVTSVTGPSQNQALTWDDAGRLATDTVTPASGTAGTTSYVYDTQGNLLLEADPGTTTVYLDDEELSRDNNSGVVTGTRYYSLGNTMIATRTGVGAVTYLTQDGDGTDTVAVDPTTQAVTRRYFDPHGNPRGTAPTGFPTGQKAFAGGAYDRTTGLTDFGSSEYQSGTALLVSPDAESQAYQPQTLNPYAFTPTSGDPGDTPDASPGSTAATNSTAAVDGTPTSGDASNGSTAISATTDGCQADACEQPGASPAAAADSRGHIDEQAQLMIEVARTMREIDAQTAIATDLMSSGGGDGAVVQADAKGARDKKFWETNGTSDFAIYCDIVPMGGGYCDFNFSLHELSVTAKAVDIWIKALAKAPKGGWGVLIGTLVGLVGTWMQGLSAKIIISTLLVLGLIGGTEKGRLKIIGGLKGLKKGLAKLERFLHDRKSIEKYANGIYAHESMICGSVGGDGALGDPLNLMNSCTFEGVNWWKPLSAPGPWGPQPPPVIVM
jgi:YD repeat-containing protein